ncbi:MAG: alpha/beta hydrolase [bacterium]|nr:alpha/beta hydrolase [bacterium]
MPFASINGVNLHYLTRGTGPEAIVFLHGFCQSSRFWEPTLEQLPDRFRGYALDLRGFGNSDKPKGPYSIPGFANDLLTFADGMGLKQFTLVGNSMGSVVCQSFATRYGNRLNKLALVSAGAYVPNPAAAQEKADLMETMEWNRSFFENAVKGFFALPPANWESHVDAAMGASRNAMVQSTRSSASLNFLESIKNIHVPTLIVQGEKDTGRTPEDGRRIQNAIPNSILHILPGAGHTPMLERPDLFHPIFLDFLQGETP